MAIYVVRHTSVNVPKGLCYGQSDVPLNASFKAETAAVKAKLPPYFSKIYTSPLSRCLLLAQVLAPKPHINPLLKEMNFGDYEGQLYDSLPPEPLKTWLDDYLHLAPPKGESFTQFYERVCQFELEDNSLIITHAGVIRCLHARLNAVPLADVNSIAISFGEVTIFE